MPHDPQLAFLNSGKRNGEFSIAYDPRSLAQQNGTNYVYAATQELTLGTDVPFPACIIAKRTVVYVSSDGGQTWARAPGSDNLPGSGAPGAAFDRARLPQGQVWATDQSIRVASDGTVYLSILDDSPYTSCADPTDVQHAAFNQVELFTSPPGAKQFTGVVVTANSERATNPSTGDIEFFDLPQLAISPTNPNLAVLFYSQNFANAATVLRTVVRGPNGSVVGPAQTNLGLGTEAALAFDENGLLYAVNSGLGVKQLQFVSASSTWATTGVAGFPPGTTTNTLYTNFNVGQIPLDPDQVFSQDNNATPGLAVGTIAGDTEPTIFLAFETNTAIANVPSVSLIKSKVSQISTPSGWSTPIPFPGPADSVSIFHPAIALDPVANLLDVLVKLTEPGDGDDHTAIHSFWARYQANTLTQSSLMPPQAVEHQTPIAGQLPGREPFVEATSPFNRFIGEYQGIALKGSTAVMAYSEFDPASLDVTMGISFINPLCSSEQFSSLAFSDAAWECSCNCTNSATGVAQMAMVQGCAPSSGTTSAICSQVCPGDAAGDAPFSAPILCAANSASTARRLATGACRLTDGRRPGRLSTNLADVAAANSASSVTMTLSGNQFNTSLAGHVYANISGPPRAGAKLEISRMDLATQPFTFSSPGLSNATVQQMTISHQGRLRGTFLDATHFVLPAAAGQIDASFVISQSGCIDPCPDITGAIHEVNKNPMTGTLDLAARTITLDISEGSGANQIQAHVQGSVTQTPPDTDGDGIFDNADNCPRIANPAQQPIAPTVTAPTPVQVTSCTGVTLVPPTVQDICGSGGITATNNAPFHFPLGTTTVTWTIKDRRGNSATTTQSVTVKMGDDPTCCPAGSHVIMGTSNNDVLVGTAGADCIIGLGGQDHITGLGGNDVISGGDGDDYIDGGSGDDILSGGSGQDHLIGGTGNDTLLGDDGDDLLEDNSGTGTLDGGQGHNTCVASGGQKTLLNCGP